MTSTVLSIDGICVVGKILIEKIEFERFTLSSKLRMGVSILTLSN